MLFVIVGLVLLGLHVAGYGSVGQWPWWAVAAPFGLALAWWTLADHFGLTERMALRRFEAKRAERRSKVMAMLGLGVARAPRSSGSAAPAASGPARPAETTAAQPVDRAGPPERAAKAKARVERAADFHDTVPSTIEVPATLGRKEDARVM
ncbi:MAG: hypothetical protein RL087_1374 [Pseudomonadota bacterium]